MFLGLLIFSDDNFAIASSINALCDIISTIEEYAVEHNLRFSTNPEPRKCKTKVIAFLKKERPLPDITLNNINFHGFTIANILAMKSPI